MTVKMWKPQRQKAFAPEGVTLGTWVTFSYSYRSNHGFGDKHYVAGAGQVWAASRGGKDPVWWVADGTEYHNVRAADMSLVGQATDATFTEMELAA
jgi:hypothetical protein